jgi:hypothetical protein
MENRLISENIPPVIEFLKSEGIKVDFEGKSV